MEYIYSKSIVEEAEDNINIVEPPKFITPKHVAVSVYYICMILIE